MTMDVLAWLANHGGTFVYVGKRSKVPFEDEWQEKPHTLAEAREHHKSGSNVGLLAGKYSNGLCLLDVDEDFERFLKTFPALAEGPRIARQNAPDRGKLLFQVQGDIPSSQKWKPIPKRPPWAEWLATGNQAVVPPSVHPSGVPFEVVNEGKPIPHITASEINAIWQEWTGTALVAQEPKKKREKRDSSQSNAELERIKDDIRAAFDMVAYACRELKAKSQRENANETRILGQGGLLINTYERIWNTFSEGDGLGHTGGDCFSLVAYLQDGKTDLGGARFFEVLRLAADYANVMLPPEYQEPLPAVKQETAGSTKEQPAVASANSRALPYNIEAEEAVLGSIMLDAGAFERVSFLSKGSFYRVSHQVIFEAIHALYSQGEPADIILLCNMLDRLGTLEKAGGRDALETLRDKVTTAIHAEHYGRIVEHNSTLRELAKAANTMGELAYSGGALPIPTIQHQAERALSQVFRRTKSSLSHIGESAIQSTNALKKLHDGEGDPALPIHLPSLARMLGGWYRGEQTVIAANTSIGKSTFARDAILNQAYLGNACLYISVEMYKDMVARLFKASIVGVDSYQFRHGYHKRDADTDEAGNRRYPFRCLTLEEVEEKSQEADAILTALPIYIMAPEKDPVTRKVNMPDFSPRGLRAEIRKFAEEHPLAMFVVDALPLLQFPETRSSAERSLIVGEASYMFREIAIETDSHNLLLHQLTPEALKDRTPTWQYFEESKKIAMNADNTLILIRPSAHGDTRARPQDMEINVAKARNERTGLVKGVWMEGATGRFSDVESRIKEQRANVRQNGNGSHEW